MAELILDGLPMAEIVQRGLADLKAGDADTQAALLARIAAPRLTEAGVGALRPFLDMSEVKLESRLFEQIHARSGNRREAFAEYKSLLDELASLENAALQRARRMGLRPIDESTPSL